jgi:hypothetical protein
MRMKRLLPLVIVGLAILALTACSTLSGRIWSFRELASQNQFRTGFNPIFAPEVVYTIKLVLEYQSVHGRWPANAGDCAVGGGADAMTGEFMRRNVEIVDNSGPIKMTVWDLLLRKNDIVIADDSHITIRAESFGTGSKSRMHKTESGASTFMDAVFHNLFLQ